MDSEAIGGDEIDARRPIGAVLGAARAGRGLELADIARETRVPARHLAAIEADSHDSLPALPYAVGFVRAFARSVGIDPDMAAARFRAETSKAAHVPQAPAMVPLDERRLPPRGIVFASLAALLAVIAGVVAWSAGAFDAPLPTQVAEAPATPPAAAVAPAAGTGATPAATSAAAPPAAAPPPAAPRPATPAAATTVLPATVPPAAVAAAASGVVITASDDAWFRVSVWDAAAGKVVTVKTGVLAKGERYVPPARPGLRLWTGRAGALQLSVDGRALPPLGGPVETVKNVSLDAADLRARLAAPGGAAPSGAAPSGAAPR